MTLASACLIAGGLLDPARAQVVDSAAVRPDSSAPPAMPANIVSFTPDTSGQALSPMLPALRPDREAGEVLSDLSGAFYYDFGGPGWPDGWSPYAFDPRATPLLWQGAPFDDPTTGRPLYELLPAAWLDPIRLRPGAIGAALATSADPRDFDGPRPITEIRYTSGGEGLQSVFVAHAQRRLVRLGRRPGSLGMTLGYGGHGAEGEYPGSKLVSGRHLLARMRWQQSFGAFELLNLHSRQHIGAHGGVIPFGSDYTSIFNRLSAQVENPSARRSSLRNDLSFTWRAPWLGRDRPLEAGVFWTAHTSRYTLASDTLDAALRRLGYRAVQPLFRRSGFDVDARVTGWTELVLRETAFADSSLPARRAFHASGMVRYRAEAFEVDGEGGWHAAWGDQFPAGRIGAIVRPASGIKGFAEVTLASRVPSWVDTFGWGDRLVPLARRPRPRTTAGRAGVRLRFGGIDVGLTAFAHEVDGAYDLFATGEGDSVAVRFVDGTARWEGAAMELGLRRDARRGFYLTLSPTLYRYAGPASTDGRRLAASLPEIYIRGRAGMRYLLFKGDLDMDLYVQGRAWSPFRSRTLHPPTGLLVLPLADSREVEASAEVDVVLEAGVRTATLFLAFDNFLSGTNVIVGNLLIPDYPLPQQRVRFGVYWPIFD